MSRSPRRRFASPKSSLKLAVASTAALVCAAASQQASAGFWQGLGTSGSIYDKYHQEQAEGHKSVGQIVTTSIFEDGSVGQAYASGVLLHRKIVITGAHVVDGATDLTFRIGNQYKKATKWVVHKNYTGDFVNGSDDVAIILLESNMTGKNIRTSKIRRNANVVGKKATYSGYGSYGSAFLGDFNNNDGNRRAGQNIIDGYWSRTFSNDLNGAPLPPGIGGTLGEFGTKNQFYTEFETPLNLTVDDLDDLHDLPIANEYTAGRGDSGGAVFIGNYLAGIPSWSVFNADNTPAYNSYSFNTNLAMYKRWIDFYVNRIHAGIRTGSSFYDPNNPFISETLAAALAGDEAAAELLSFSLRGRVVPEPSSLALIGAGALLAMRRRRRA